MDSLLLAAKEIASPKEKWVRVALSIVAGIFTAGVSVGITSAQQASRFAEIEHRQVEIEKYDIPRIALQQQLNTNAISILQAKSEATISDMNQIRVSLGKIDQKLDDLKEAIRSQAK